MKHLKVFDEIVYKKSCELNWNVNKRKKEILNDISRLKIKYKLKINSAYENNSEWNENIDNKL